MYFYFRDVQRIFDEENRAVTPKRGFIRYLVINNLMVE